jgi:histidyl-tRNA synthetase
MSKPSIPKGTRDFLPDQVIKRNFIFSTIRSVFEKYGFLPIETPAMEELKTLTGKYGEEGDRLLFKVLNNGDYLNKANKEALANLDSYALTPSISKRGLRYDLTVPFARYVVMHQNELQFPFKRYQIQPVWRADRPQKGRYQEFYQCDVDVVGSTSLMYEAELIQIYNEAFENLGVDVIIKVNNRKVLFGLAESAGVAEQFMDMTIAIDKLDKIGSEGVKKEMLGKGIDETSIDQILTNLQIDNLDDLEKAFVNSETGLQGINELRQVHQFVDTDQLKNEVRFDITLARGLNYYTGCIFEVQANPQSYPELVMGSIGGGGRYDNLTEVFGMKDMSGVGISFGAARIFDVMEEEGLFPQGLANSVPLLFMGMDEESHVLAFSMASQLREAGIPCDVYPEAAKFKKQMKYANAKAYPFTAIIGEEERLAGLMTLKNMSTGEQQRVDLDALIQQFKVQ